VLELLKTGNYDTSVFGGRKPEWETEEVSEDSEKPTPSEDEAAKKEQKQKRVDAVAAALGTTPAGGTPPATVATLTGDQKDEMNVVLKEGDLSVAQMQQLFTNPTDPALAPAILEYGKLKDGRHMMSAEMGGVAIQGGKIDSQSFVAAMAAYQQPTSAPGTGGAPVTGNPSPTPPQPGSGPGEPTPPPVTVPTPEPPPPEPPVD
jgi:hypothetical protein